MNDLILEDYRIATDDPAVSLYMRNKRRADVRLGVPDRTLLFVHGATYASTVTFDMPLAGRSWMDELAGAGFDVWLIDLRGYGASDRPAEMAAPPEANGPIVHTAVAVADLGRPSTTCCGSAGSIPCSCSAIRGERSSPGPTPRRTATGSSGWRSMPPTCWRRGPR